MLARICGCALLISTCMARCQAAHHPWDDRTMSPDQRAEMVLKEMTLDEKLQMTHGVKWSDLYGKTPGEPSNPGGEGLMPGIPRLGVPDVYMADSAVGVRLDPKESRYATALPSTLGAAASWDTDAAFAYGKLVGHELRELGLNMSIGGGVNLLREPRNGRNFEYAGEDPLLAGTMVGTLEAGVASEHIMNDIKHYALNDEETGRTVYDVRIDERAMRESDLLAFEIALEIAKPSAVMCSYNLVAGDHACENDVLLNKILKGEFHFQGFVVSDWSATHSTGKAAVAGLDMEMPTGKYMSKLGETIAANEVPMSRLDDMARRILRSIFASGVVDEPLVRTIVDPFKGRDVAQRIEEESLVLLKNDRAILPLTPKVQRIALIGAHADVGMISGGGSSQVHPPGGNAWISPDGKQRRPVYLPSSPMREIALHAPEARISFDEGYNPKSAAESARGADVAIVFVTQPMSEGHDAASLTLPDHQDDLVAAVAAANPHTIVVVESGGPVTMPWKDAVAGIVEAWYAGIGGAQALANTLFGTVNFSGKLPASFARTEADLPHPVLPGSDRLPAVQGKPDNRGFEIDYTEGARVGYKWFESENKQPLFPFGFGLSYTTFGYSDLHVDAKNLTATMTVKNAGARSGAEIAELYAQLPASSGEKFKRLVGWQRVTLAPGESQTFTVKIDKRMVSIFDVASQSWKMPAGRFELFAGGSSVDLPLHAALQE
jgi:beta-glucosidase